MQMLGQTRKHIVRFSAHAMFLLFSIGIAGCQSASTASNGNPALSSDVASSDGARRVEDLQIVDCSLPGQTRFLGNTSYLTPRRPTRTTSADCRVRGGEYVAYDRADYKTALNVWMTTAESGDAEAQANVGEIFERGLGGTPNYQAALIWYTKAAEQGNKRAQFNLGTLYEQGSGVKQDPVTAMNWYRKAWGIPADDIVFRSYMQKQIDVNSQQAHQELEKKDQQIRVLEQQLQILRKSSAQNTALKAQLAGLQSVLDDLRKQRVTAAADIQPIQLREPGREVDSPLAANTPSVIAKDKLNFGRYFALVIGTQDYQKITPLKTPISDANAVADVLQHKYGFAVTRLLDVDNVAIMEAINNFNNVLGDDDNLLIYYAGHGSRTKVDNHENGYWLAVNADPPPRDTFWITNEFVTRHLSIIKARRVLVVADSCYAGMLSNDPGYLLLGNESKPNAAYMRYKLARRSRLLLTSGGDAPVLDNGGGKNSVFAHAFIDVLSSADRILTAPEVYGAIRQRVEKAAATMQFKQAPELKAIKEAGHEVGDFFFVPTDSTAKVAAGSHVFKEDLYVSRQASQ
jgi:hypothetical protein